MELNFKNHQSFLNEITEIRNESDCSILEAIVEYSEKYGLDFEYIAKNLISQGIQEDLRIEAEILNVLKKDKITHLPL
jgi:hypothetical protein